MGLIVKATLAAFKRDLAQCVVGVAGVAVAVDGGVAVGVAVVVGGVGAVGV